MENTAIKELSIQHKINFITKQPYVKLNYYYTIKITIEANNEDAH